MEKPATHFPGLLVPTPLGFEGLLVHEGRDIRIYIELDGSPEASSLALARKIAADLAQLDEKCRRLIADHAFSSYHVAWRGGGVAPGAATLNATLSATLERLQPDTRECAERFKLSAIEVTGAEGSSLQYDCAEQPLGASVLITAFDRGAFDSAHVDLYH
jgi:hypothetical protein